MIFSKPSKCVIESIRGAHVSESNQIIDERVENLDSYQLASFIKHLLAANRDTIGWEKTDNLIEELDSIYPSPETFPNLQGDIYTRVQSKLLSPSDQQILHDFCYAHIGVVKDPSHVSNFHPFPFINAQDNISIGDLWYWSKNLIFFQSTEGLLPREIYDEATSLIMRMIQEILSYPKLKDREKVTLACYSVFNLISKKPEVIEFCSDLLDRIDRQFVKSYNGVMDSSSLDSIQHFPYLEGIDCLPAEIYDDREELTQSSIEKLVT